MIEAKNEICRIYQKDHKGNFAASKMKQVVQRLENGRYFCVRSIQDLFANETYLYNNYLFFGVLQRPFPELLTQAITAIQTPINFINSSSIAHQIQQNVTDDVDQITIIFNQFKNVVQQVVKRVDLLNRKNFIAQFRLVTNYDTAEPEKEFIQNYIYEYYIATAFYHAMENALKNAGEMLDQLRTSQISVELCEIISGASAV